MDDELDTMETEVRYVLRDRFSYARQGEQVEAQFVVLRAPSSRNSKPCAALEQAFFRATREQAGSGEAVERDADVPVPEITGSDIMVGIAASATVELGDVMEVGRTLFTQPGVALIEGETQMKPKNIDDMSLRDFKAMLGQYVRDFLIASSLPQTSGPSSKESPT